MIFALLLSTEKGIQVQNIVIAL